MQNGSPGRVEQDQPARIWLVIGTHRPRLDRSSGGAGKIGVSARPQIQVHH
jgi:hypothetical protein